MTSSRHATGHLPRRLLARFASLVGTAALLSACGVPGDGHVRTVDDDEVPYHLLAPDPSASVPTNDASVPGRVPVVFWLVDDDHLAPAAAGGACSDPPEELAIRQLTDLAAGPGEDVRSAGRSSALPTAPGLRLVGLADGVAQVEMDPSTSISADRVPLAVAQVVLSLTSTPGIDKVLFLTSGESVQVPLPGGALTTRAVSASDYATLVVHRARASTPGAPRLARSIGCDVR